MSYASRRALVKHVQGRIRALLHQHVKEVRFSENSAINTFGFEFVCERKNHRGDIPVVVRINIPIWPQGEPWYAHGHEARVVDQIAWREHQVWSVLYRFLQAHLKAVECGLWSFEDAFLAHVVD